MKAIKLTLLCVLFAAGCTNFEEFQVDPNRATQTHPALLLTNIEALTFNYISINAAFATRQMVFTDGASDEQYYNWQRGDFGRYNILRQVKKMDDEATRLNLENYRALALFFRAVHIIELSKMFGDVPFSESVRAETGNFTPAYDRQEAIYTTVLDDLGRAAASLRTGGGPITGDIIYQGDLTKWKKLINSFTLRVLLSMSRKGGAVGQQVIARFNTIVSNPSAFPIFQSNDDNASLHFQDLADNRYPFFNSNAMRTAYYMEESFINLLRNLQDPRLFDFADLTPQAQRSGLDATDFAAYGGADGSAPLATNIDRVVAGTVSRINPRYYNHPVNEPSNLLSYAEVQFTLAEAAARGWIAANPGDLYENGIEASFEFYDTPGVGDYLAQPRVRYNAATGIEQIITQKYITFFMNGNWEAFYNHLRTGFPAFSVGGGGVLNNQRVPRRWMYPQDELILNQANVVAAVSRQFATDDVNGEMWLLRN